MQLFAETRLAGVTLPNRIVRSATWEGMCDNSDGTVQPALGQLYQQLCHGGTGLLMSGYAYVRADGKQLPGQMGIDNDAQLPGLSQLVETVHQAGSRIFCQLVHAGGQTSSKAIGSQPLAPSEGEHPVYPEPAAALSQEQIDQLVQAFAAGARRAQQAGFDGVQLHGAHGYLINQFLSPWTNQRQDGYGGPLDNRMRFLQEVYRAVRQQVGPDYPVAIKLTAADNVEGGFTCDEALEVAQQLDQWGIAAIEVSSGTGASGKLSPVRQEVSSAEEEAYNLDFAQAIKAKVKAPVMCVGGFRTGQVAADAVQQGSADFIALSRPLIREPDLPRKWQQDLAYRARCISCNGCFKPGIKEGGIRCVQEDAA